MRQTHEREGHAGTAESQRLHLAELESLQEALASAAGSLADPPLAITRERARLLRQVMADVTGYQSGELTVSLRPRKRLRQGSALGGGLEQTRARDLLK
jgi:hypothetical protein